MGLPGFARCRQNTWRAVGDGVVDQVTRFISHFDHGCGASLMIGMIASPVYGQAGRWPEHSTGNCLLLPTALPSPSRFPPPRRGRAKEQNTSPATRVPNTIK